MRFSGLAMLFFLSPEELKHWRWLRDNTGKIGESVKSYKILKAFIS